MIKKLLTVAVIAAVAVVALKSPRLGSFARQEVSDLRDWADSQVPPEKEIKRLRGDVKDLDKDILKVAGMLAKENVETRDLREQVADYRAKHEGRKLAVQKFAQAIKDSSTEKVSFNNRVMSVDAAKQELAAEVTRCNGCKKTLESMELTLASRERTRETLVKQLDTLKTQKQDLSTAIDSLEAEVTVLKLQQMENKYQTDNTRLASIKESIRGLRKKIDMEREQLNLAGTVYGSEPAAGSPTANRTVDDILSGLDAKPEAKKIGNAD